MNIRRAAPFVFAALCLGLSAFVLRGQIAARPVPRPAPDSAPSGPPDSFSPRTHPPGFRVTSGRTRRDVVAVIGDQLAAIRAGDADRAWSYQSRGLHRNFPSAQAFVAQISGSYPEFGRSKSATYGPVWADQAGTYAEVAVTVRGQNGRLAPAHYLLIREDGGYKVAGVMGGRAVN